MTRSGFGRLLGLPKELVVVMLGLALAATVGVDITSSPTAARSAAPVSQVGGSTTTTRVPVAVTTPPSSTTVATTPPTTATPPSTAPRLVSVVQPPRSTGPAPPRHLPAATAAKPTPSPGSTQVARTVQSIPFGVYVGAGDPSGIASFAAATGTHPVFAADYLPTDAGWAGMTDPSALSWLLGSWRGTGYTLVLGVPMIPTDSNGNAQGTLAQGAAGAYDQYFTTLADSLVSYGEGNAVLRLGWEFNGNWYPWSVTDATDAANFAAYFRNIVTSMRSVPGQAFRFVWNPDSGGSFGSYTPEEAYPGNAYVDAIGLDVYDQCWSSPSTPQNAWTEALTSGWSLDWLAGFAAAEGRPMVFPEWGVMAGGDGYGMGDDPYFIDQFGTWIVQHDVAWTAYFNYDASDGAHDLFDGSFPATLAEFRSVFG